jgi:hypothetical protein
VGYQALTSNTTGAYNKAFGVQALRFNTTGGNNVAIGQQALYNNTTASYNTAVGYQAGYGNTDSLNLALFGWRAGYSITTGGSNNSFFGTQAGYSNTTAYNNVAIGRQSFFSNTTGLSNVAVGASALYSNTTASYNTAVGYLAGYNVTTGLGNTLVGGGTSGGANPAGYSVTTGQNNNFFGGGAGGVVTTGSGNTIVGNYNGNLGGLDIRTSSNNIVLSDGDGNPRAVCNGTYGAWVFGGSTYQAPNSTEYSEFQTASSSIQLGLTRKTTSAGTSYIGADSSYILRVFTSAFATKFQVDTSGNVTSSTGSYGTISDQRFKENIQDSGSQWDDIKAIQVKKYSMIEDGLDAPNQIGVIAQDLEASGMSGLVTTTDVPDVEGDGTTEMKTVKYSILYMKAVKALQEAMERIETLEARIAALES